MTYWTPTTLSKHLAERGRKLSTRYIRRLCNEGRIVAIKPGVEWLIEDEEAQRWISEWTTISQ